APVEAGCAGVAGGALSPRVAEERAPASGAEVERITTLLLDALDLSGFTSLRRVADSDERIRRLVRRLNLPARDAVIWLGMLRQMAWKLRNPDHDPKAGKH